MITTIVITAVLSAPVPPDLLMLQDTLGLYYDNPYILLYSCPIPALDHYGVGEMELMSQDTFSLDDWFVIGDTLVSREIDTTRFLFMPANGEEAVDVAAWLASVMYGGCELLSVEAIPTPTGYTIQVSLTVFNSQPTMGNADSMLELLYVVNGDRWHLEDPDEVFSTQ